MDGFVAVGFGDVLLAVGAEEALALSLSFLSSFSSSFFVGVVTGLLDDFVGMDLVGTGLHCVDGGAEGTTPELAVAVTAAAAMTAI